MRTLSRSRVGNGGCLTIPAAPYSLGRCIASHPVARRSLLDCSNAGLRALLARFQAQGARQECALSH